MKALARALVFAPLIAAAIPAAADPIDTFGFDARGRAMANAMTAASIGASSAFYNPAGGALADDPHLVLGYSFGAMNLQINDRDARVTTPRGVSLGLGMPVRCGAECTAAFSFGLYMPDQFAARIQATPPSEPRFLLLDNDVDRAVVNPTLSLRLGWFAVGAGITFLSDAAGNGIDFRIGARGGMKLGQASADVALPIRIAPIVGVMIKPHRRVRFGLSYRGEIDVRLRLDILAHVDIPGGGDVAISVRAINFFTPHKLSMGVAVDATDRLTLLADASYARWSGFDGGVTDLRFLVNLEISPSLLQSTFPSDRLHDTIALRGGGEWRREMRTNLTLALRGGVAFEPTPVPEQIYFTSFADNDRLLVTIGAGLAWAKIAGFLEKPFSLDLSLGWHQLLPRETKKLDPALPSFSSGGSILHLALSATASF